MNEDLAGNFGAKDENANHEAGYAYRVITVREAVERCVSGEWDIAEFQRQFVWRPSQVCALADSLWRNYPFGSLLLWRAQEEGNGERRVRWWIADGHQRLTSLCILSGREPIWFRRRAAESPRRMPPGFEPCFDAGADAAAAFVATRAGDAARDARLVPVSRLLALDPDEARGISELHKLVETLKTEKGCLGMDLAELYRRLSRVSMLDRRELAATLVWQERKHVLEIFARLNSRGMRFRRLLLKLAMEEIPTALRGARRG
ncbi:MAG TPA: DUF262 domain-containing protein [Candidatus Binataceae bacterium]|nr:DUF262 domain-containing protein [Candidatus Binataceae bacterium]